MKDKEIFWIDEDRAFMRQKNWQRPITSKSFFLNEKLEWMETNNIDHAVILNLSQLYGNGLAQSDMKQALRFQNDFNAEIQANHPKKFTSGFVIHAGFVDGALWEIERCVEKLGLKVLCLLHIIWILLEIGKEFSIPETEPILELANKYNLAIEVHPYDGEKFIQLENISWRFHLVWMLAQCADSYHFYTLNGYYDKYPNIRTCLLMVVNSTTSILEKNTRVLMEDPIYSKVKIAQVKLLVTQTFTLTPWCMIPCHLK
jgi:aminocarboxymuconate-semialdehyde decarboxylase